MTLACKSHRTAATLALAIAWVLAGAEGTAGAGAGSGDIGPWIATMEVYAVPASALIVGADFEPFQPLDLSIADPDGRSTTWTISADADGRLFEYVPVDLPGLYTAEIRDELGVLLSSTPIFAAGS